MDRTGVVASLVNTLARATLVPLQVPPNGTNATNTTTPTPSNGTAINASNTTGDIQQGTQRSVEFFQGIWQRVTPDGVPIPPEWLIQFAFALAVLIAAWYLSKLVVRLLSRRVARRFRRPSVVQTVLGSIRSAIMLVAVFVALAVSGLVEVGNIVISATVLTAATVLVLTPIIGSVVNGLLILADQPYEIGDMIEFVDSTNSKQVGQRGFVEDITLRYTKIFTLDNTFIVVPNSSMRDQDVINYSAEDPRTRLRLDVLVTYEGDLDEARALIERAARDVRVVVTGGPDIRIGSARYPAAPTCYVNEFADHGILLTLRYWAREPYKLLTVRSLVQENVWSALDGADVEMAYPHSHLFFDGTSGTLPVSVEDDRRGLGDGLDRPRSAADDGRPSGDRQGRRARSPQDRESDSD